MKSSSMGGLLLAMMLAGAAHAAEPLRIGVVNDRSGLFADYGGEGSAIAARLAAEDVGGTVLGRKIEILAADHQNKPDIASTIVRQMFDEQGVEVIADGAASSAALAIQGVARARGKIFLISGASAVELTGKECSPTGFQFSADTYAIANGTAQAVLKAGGKSWFFVTADYAFGLSLEQQARSILEANGGKVMGAVKHPLNTTDFSAYVLQAQSSRADVVGLASAGADLVNAIKQAQEFGLPASGQKLAGFLLDIVDVRALGLASAQGLVFVDSFYWDLSDETRAFSERFVKANRGVPPSQIQAATYSAVLHYLKAVKAASTSDGAAVAAKMKEMPIVDMYHQGTRIRADGRVMNDLYLTGVKTPAESKGPFDLLSISARLPGEQMYRPIEQGGCPLVSK